MNDDKFEELTSKELLVMLERASDLVFKLALEQIIKGDLKDNPLLQLISAAEQLQKSFVSYVNSKELSRH